MQESPENPKEDQNEAQEKEELDKYIQELSGKIKQRSELRKKNVNVNRQAEEYFVKLDSSLKKNTAFVKKLKNFTSAQLDSLIKDMNGLNLTKYISEVAAALIEAKLKMSDIGGKNVLANYVTSKHFSIFFLFQQF